MVRAKRDLKYSPYVGKKTESKIIPAQRKKEERKIQKKKEF